MSAGYNLPPAPRIPVSSSSAMASAMLAGSSGAAGAGSTLPPRQGYGSTTSAAAPPPAASSNPFSAASHMQLQKQRQQEQQQQQQQQLMYEQQWQQWQIEQQQQQQPQSSSSSSSYWTPPPQPASFDNFYSAQSTNASVNGGNLNGNGSAYPTVFDPTLAASAAPAPTTTTASTSTRHRAVPSLTPTSMGTSYSSTLDSQPAPTAAFPSSASSSTLATSATSATSLFFPPASAATAGTSATSPAAAFTNVFLPQAIAQFTLGTPVDNILKGAVQQRVDGLFAWLRAYKLKYYFQVNNTSVLRKLKVLLLPFLHKNWSRERVDGIPDADASSMHQQHGHGHLAHARLHAIYQVPSVDVNAPDLYIPTMAFFTYILCFACARGVDGGFQPDVIGILASSTFVTLLLELFALKCSFYVWTDVQAPPLLDLIAYLSYKYVHCVAAMLCGLFFGSRWLFSIAILVFGACSGLFLMRTLKRVLAPTLDAVAATAAQAAAQAAQATQAAQAAIQAAQAAQAQAAQVALQSGASSPAAQAAAQQAVQAAQVAQAAQVQAQQYHALAQAAQARSAQAAAASLPASGSSTSLPSSASSSSMSSASGSSSAPSSASFDSRLNYFLLLVGLVQLVLVAFLVWTTVNGGGASGSGGGSSGSGLGVVGWLISWVARGGGGAGGAGEGAGAGVV